MFFDLNVPVQKSSLTGYLKKSKESRNAAISYSVSELACFEKRIDLLIHLGYTIIAFSQTVKKRIDAKTHVNALNPLISALRTRRGIVYLKRLNIVLDQDSEKGFGLINANVSLLNSYDLLALIPTTHITFSSACLTHSLPSNLTTHIISLPLTLPRLPYHLKHTLVRTAIKNGAVFEINYVGSVGGESDPVVVDANAAENGPNARRNWWAAARELVRVTKGKGLLISGGVCADPDYRAPRDVANLIAMLGIPQDAAHHALTTTPKSLIFRAETRKTYRAVLSEPTVIVPLIEIDVPKGMSVTEEVEGTHKSLQSGKIHDTLAPVKRPHEGDDDPRNGMALQGSKKKKRKSNKSDRTNS